MQSEILTQEANDIVIYASQAIDHFMVNNSHYPTIEYVAARVNADLPIYEKITIHDIETSSAMLALQYPVILGADVPQSDISNEFIISFKQSLASHIGTTKVSNAMLIVGIMLVGIYIFQKEVNYA